MEGLKPIRRQPWIGGPGSKLPPAVESFLSWSLALGCLSVSGYHYLVGTIFRPHLARLRRLLQSRRRIEVQEEEELQELPCWLPLTTYTRAEAERCTAMERYRQLVSLLVQNPPPSMDAGPINIDPLYTDDELVRIIREDVILRRVVSLAMRPPSTVWKLPLGQQLVRIWDKLLELPMDRLSYNYAISLVIPCHGDAATDVVRKLVGLLEAAREPKQIELLVVDAGGCDFSLSKAIHQQRQHRRWFGATRVLRFREGAGRGPCLNFGADHATGRILAFLHSDTFLPPGWDESIVKAFEPSERRSNACAFRFGIDRSGFPQSYRPPGIDAIEFTANVRCWLWSLPYGDQCLCVPAVVFRHLGGFPYQPIMEDYELVSLLRRRAALASQFQLSQERLVILKDKARCSPRRWQRFGVLYVTYLNSLLVTRYEQGFLSSNDIYHIYYNSFLNHTNPSPWEHTLQSLLHKV